MSFGGGPATRIFEPPVSGDSSGEVVGSHAVKAPAEHLRKRVKMGATNLQFLTSAIMKWRN